MSVGHWTTFALLTRAQGSLEDLIRAEHRMEARSEDLDP